MKTTYVQHKVITIPATTVTQIYQTLFKADDCYQFLTGVATVFSGSAPSADVFEIELRDDYNSVLSFSPAENWLKNPTSATWNLQDVFKPLNIDARGRNFYLNVKVKNLASPFSFTALILQETKITKPVCDYDEQTFEIATPALGQGYSITLPSNYNFVKGMMLSGGDAVNAGLIAFDITDSLGQIVDPLPMSILKPTSSTPYDLGFFPVNFESKSRQIFVRLTEMATLSTAYTPTNYNVTFLLTK